MKHRAFCYWAQWLVLSSLISLTLRAEVFTTEMVPFLATTADYDPSKIPLSSLHELQSLIQQTPPVSDLRVTRVRQQLKILTGYQFSDFLTVRELIANSADAYYHNASFAPANRKVEVHTDATRGILTVQDQGVGMSLHDIVFYLLTPTRSKNPFVMERGQAKEGVTGRFGQGFFSVFSFLQNSEDRIVAETQTEGGRPLSLLRSFYLRLKHYPSP